MASPFSPNRTFPLNASSRSTPVGGLEWLESRRYFSAIDSNAVVGPALPGSDILTGAPPAGVKADRAASYYAPARKVTIHAGRATSTSSRVLVRTAAADSALAADISYSTNAAGLPLLSSRADGAGLEVFLDFDGYSTSDTPYDTDGDGTTFVTAEQKVIYSAWRDVVSFLAPLNVNVTTVQPATGGSNPVFLWQVIANNGSGTAYVGTINNSTPRGWNAASSARGRTSAIAHEIGHQLNLYHQGVFAADGTQIAEYSSGYTAHGPLSGSDYAEEVHKWIYGRTGSGTTFQDDLARMTTYIASKSSSYGDGYRPDDYTGTTTAAAFALPLVNGSYQAAGIIERNADADFFRFTSAGGTFNVNVEPTFESGLAPKLELYDSTGKLIAAKDDTSYRGWEDNTGQEVTLDLAAGQYVVRVSGHGDYGDQGEYAVYASPLPTGWASRDITDNGTGRGGFVAYDAASGSFLQGGGGAFSGAGGIGAAEDDFRFTYQVLNGNGSITARVTGLENTAATDLTTDAVAGVMLRETLADDARFGMVAFTPTGSRTLYRTTVAGTATSLGGSSAMPGWVRVTRNGNTITLNRSSDGTTFNAGNTVTFTSLATQVYVGLAVTSGTSIELATAGFDNVTTTGTLGTTPTTFNTLAAPAGLTATPYATQSTGITLNWSDVAGETGFAVERSVDGVNWVQINTVGANVTAYNTVPAFGAMRYWYRVAALDAAGKGPYSAPVSVVNKPAAPTNPLAMRVSSTYVSLSWRDTSGETGYRVERTADGGATWTTLTTTPTNITGYNVTTGLVAGTAYQFRVTPLSAAGDGVPLLVPLTTPLPTVTGLAFTNKAIGNVGLTWSAVANATGYRVERSTDRATWASIGTTTTATTFTDTTAAALTHYYYRVIGTATGNQSANGDVIFFATPAATASASPWINTDIGTVGGTGAGYISGTNATVIGGGGNAVTTTTDTQNFLYRTLTGDGEIVARVSAMENINDYTKAGVMFRETLANNARYAAVLYQSNEDTYGTDMAARSTVGGTAVAIDGQADTAYTYLRLVRQGNAFSGYTSLTGAAGSWVLISTRTITMAQTVYVGLWGSARDDDYLSKATFTNVAVTPATVPTVSSLVVNDGSAQRSRVTSMKLTFSTPVTLAANAVTLWRRLNATSAATQVTGFTLTPSAGNTVYTLTFAGATFEAGSLADGLYEVRVAATGVTNTDGFAMAANTTFNDYRLFGDIDASRSVDFNDFLSFQTAFGSTAGSGNYVSGFDTDNNGKIDFNDFLKLQTNFGQTL